MANKLVIHPKARQDVFNAIDYYKELSSELSDDLLDKFRTALNNLVANPFIYPTIRGKYRKVNLDRFPYKIVFRVKDDTLVVVAFAHHKRNPSYWRNR